MHGAGHLDTRPALGRSKNAHGGSKIDIPEQPAGN